MEQFDPSAIIQNSNRITDIFGYWPTFHDAEVHTLSLSGGVADPCLPECECPLLELKIHLWEMTKEVDAEGGIVLAKHTLTEMRFRNIEKLELSNFNYHNCIMEMKFGMESENLHPIGGGRNPPMITVEIEPSFGLHAKFKCQSAEVLSAVSCESDGPSAGRLGSKTMR
ncbi:MAG: Imm50 family immunity protein [Terracidiphilus sp.]